MTDSSTVNRRVDINDERAVMKNDEIKTIVTLCLFMDRQAVKLYRNLSKATSDKRLKTFWKTMSQKEGEHVSCWEKLLDLVKENAVPQIFKNPGRIIKELNHHYNNIAQLTGKSLSITEITEQFVTALRLEFYLLHPAFERLWHFYGIIRKEAYNPEKSYDNHIKSFILTMRDHGVSSMELESLGDTLEIMWLQSQEMAHDAYFDELTGVLNRKGVNHAIHALANLGIKDNLNSGLLMIRIDHFKQINDKYGHQTGDKTLETVAKIIQSNIRSTDIPGRFSGKELIVFIPQINQNLTKSVAEKIRRAVANETRDGIPATISIGAANKVITEPVEKAVEALIKDADNGLVKAKKQGSNQVVINSGPTFE